MSEYIVNVPAEEGEYLIARFGLENVKLLGHGLTGGIVRCGDCANLNNVDKCPCGFWALENPNGFCAWGERKAVEHG